LFSPERSTQAGDGIVVGHHCCGAAGAKQSVGGAAPGTGGLNGSSVSDGDGATSGGACVPGATSDNGAGAPGGGVTSAPPAGGGALRGAGGGETGSAVCA